VEKYILWQEGDQTMAVGASDAARERIGPMFITVLDLEAFTEQLPKDALFYLTDMEKFGTIECLH